MNKLHITGLGVVIAAAFGAGVLAQQTATPPAARPAPPQATGAIGPVPANLGPLRISGVGITVADLDKQKAWYETVLGMHQVGQFPATGTPNEYIMSMSTARDDNAPVIALLKGTRQPGATSYGRVILRVPNSQALAQHMMTHGVTARMVAAGAYFISDPEGNNIELYTPPPGG